MTLDPLSIASLGVGVSAGTAGIVAGWRRGRVSYIDATLSGLKTLNDELHSEVTRLSTENSMLRKELAQTREEVAELRGDLRDVLKLIASK